MPLHGVESGKQTHFVPGIAALFYEGRWRFTTVGRGRPPALIRLARRSPNPKSDQRASHLLSRTREGTLKGVRKQTHLTDSEEKAKLTSRSFAYERRPRSRFRPRLP